MKEITHKGLARLVGVYGSYPIDSNNLETLESSSVEPDRLNREEIGKGSSKAITTSIEWLVDHTVKAKELAIQYINEATSAYNSGDQSWSRWLGWCFHFITDWHCRCPVHINTNKECKHIKLVKLWLGFNGKKDNAEIKKESLTEKRFNAVMFKLLELESKLDNLSKKKEDHLIVRGKTWDDGKIRLLYITSKHNEGRFESMKKYFIKKEIEFKDLTEDDLIEYGHIKDHLADLTVNTHRVFCRTFCKAMYPNIFTKDLYELFPTIKRPHKKKRPPLPTDLEIRNIKKKLQKLSLDNEDELLLFIEIALPFEICDRRTLYSDLKKESFHIDTIDNSYVRYNYGKYKQDNAKAIKSPKLLEALKRIFKKFPKEYFPYLFTNKHTGDKIDDKTITRNFNKFCGFNTHAVRYKYATELYKNGYSSKHIAEMLGIQEQTLKHYIQEKQIVQIQDTREIPNLVLV